jgi:hypothetical protein
MGLEATRLRVGGLLTTIQGEKNSGKEKVEKVENWDIYETQPKMRVLKRTSMNIIYKKGHFFQPWS